MFINYIFHHCSALHVTLRGRQRLEKLWCTNASLDGLMLDYYGKLMIEAIEILLFKTTILWFSRKCLLQGSVSLKSLTGEMNNIDYLVTKASVKAWAIKGGKWTVSSWSWYVKGRKKWANVRIWVTLTRAVTAQWQVKHCVSGMCSAQNLSKVVQTQVWSHSLRATVAQISLHTMHYSLLCMELWRHRLVRVASYGHDWTIKQWKKVTRSDESCFLIHHVNDQVHVYP